MIEGGVKESRKYLTTQDLADHFEIEIESARALVRKHKAILKPFLIGRENRFLQGSFEKLIEHLQSGEDNKK